MIDRLRKQLPEQDFVLKIKVSEDGVEDIQVVGGRWEDPEIWGTILADAAVTIGKMFSSKKHMKKYMTKLEKTFSHQIRDPESWVDYEGEP